MRDNAFDKSPPAVTSWRQEMFNKVVTPSKDEIKTRRTKEELRMLWKTAIKQALLLIRMEKENERLTGNIKQQQSYSQNLSTIFDSSTLRRICCKKN